VGSRLDANRILGLSALLRLLLTAWGYLHDRLLPFKYTDIDYTVFTDAARYVAAGQSPFQRATYRYSPLLAYLLVPNVLLADVWGKVSWWPVCSSWLCTSLQTDATHFHWVVCAQSAAATPASPTVSNCPTTATCCYMFPHLAAASAHKHDRLGDGCCICCHLQAVFVAADLAAALQIKWLVTHSDASPGATSVALLTWLVNPFTATISTRGSCDALVAVLLLQVSSTPVGPVLWNVVLIEA
jgi:hypothetical protein